MCARPPVRVRVRHAQGGAILRLSRFPPEGGGALSGPVRPVRHRVAPRGAPPIPRRALGEPPCYPRCAGGRSRQGRDPAQVSGSTGQGRALLPSWAERGRRAAPFCPVGQKRVSARPRPVTGGAPAGRVIGRGDRPDQPSTARVDRGLYELPGNPGGHGPQVPPSTEAHDFVRPSPWTAAPPTPTAARATAIPLPPPPRPITAPGRR